MEGVASEKHSSQDVMTGGERLPAANFWNSYFSPPLWQAIFWEGKRLERSLDFRVTPMSEVCELHHCHLVSLNLLFLIYKR